MWFLWGALSVLFFETASYYIALAGLDLTEIHLLQMMVLKACVPCPTKWGAFLRIERMFTMYTDIKDNVKISWDFFFIS